MEHEISERIMKWLKGKTAPPYMLQIWPTLKCNLNCIYCWRRLRDKIPKEKISPERYVEIINEAGNIGMKRVEIAGGGEPLIFKKIFELIKLIKSFGMIGTMTSNGTLFDNNSVKLMIDIQWDLLTISFDGPSSNIHNKIRGNGAYEKTLETLKLFHQWKKKLNSDLPKIILIPVLSNLNYKSIPKFFELAKEFGIDSIDFKPLILYEGAYEKYQIKKDHLKELKEIIEESLILSEKYNISTNLRNYLDEFFTLKSPSIIPILEEDMKKSKKIPCFMPWYFMKVFDEAAGVGAGPCLVPDNSVRDDIINKSLEGIWYGHKANQLRKLMIEGKIPKFCETCCGGALLDNKKIRENFRKIGI